VKQEGAPNLGYSVLGYKVSDYVEAVALFMSVLFGFPESRYPLSQLLLAK